MLGGLRIKPYRRVPGSWEMTWGFGDGMRALFYYGDEIRPGERHIIWIMVGDHSIL